MKPKLSALPLLAGVALLALLSCAGGDTGRSWRGEMDTLTTGTIVVRNPQDRLWSTSAAWRVEEQLRIGQAEGTGPALFGRIAAVAQDSAGVVYVLDQQAQEVRVFAADGQYVHTIGRSGGGPGEFRNAFGLAFDQYNRLWTVDATGGRYQVFSAGALLHTHPRSGGVVYPFLGGHGPNGSLYDVMIETSEPGIVTYHYVGFDPATSQLDSLPPLIYPRRGDAPNSMALFRVLPRLIFQFDGRGFLWFAMTDKYQIHQRSLTGDTIRIIERRVSPLPIPDNEREELAQQIRQSQFPEEANRIPSHRPLFERLVLDEEGFLYVMLAAAAGAAATAFDVFDPLGRYLGQLNVPAPLAASPVPTIRRGQLLGVTQDADGGNQVVRYRIVKPTPGDR